MSRPDTQQLIEMLTYARPAGSRTEQRFIERYIKPTGAQADAYGNYLLRIGESKVLWSAHTDTVHRRHGRVGVELVTRIDVSKQGQLTEARSYVEAGAESSCLGADDTTGVWILLHMIKANVPGLYVFHRAEETGCNGSNFIATETPEVLNGIEYAIAFDRKGKGSIITHQTGLRTASDEFAWELAAAIGLDGLMPDDSGLFTDTIEYAHMVPECTNISVGYESAHSTYEKQDLDFAVQLCSAMMQFDEAQISVYRDPFNDPDARWLKYAGNADHALFAESNGEMITCEMCGRETQWGYMLGRWDVCRDCFEDLTEQKAEKYAG